MIENRYMSVKETAKYMSIGLNLTYKLCQRSDFPTIRVGNKILVDRQLLDAVWMDNKRKTTLKGKGI